MIRIKREVLFMEVAKMFAQRGACQRLQTGAVIIQDNRIVSTGYNGPPSGALDCYTMCGEGVKKPCTRAIHAEANAIYFAAKHGIPLQGATMYCTHSPCIKCAEAIIQAGIIEVCFAEEFRDTEGLDVLFKSQINVTHDISV